MHCNGIWQSNGQLEKVSPPSLKKWLAKFHWSSVICIMSPQATLTARTIVQGLMNECIAVKAENLPAIWTGHNNTNIGCKGQVLWFRLEIPQAAETI